MLKVFKITSIRVRVLEKIAQSKLEFTTTSTFSCTAILKDMVTRTQE